MVDGTFKEYAVEDYAWRYYRHMGGDTARLPDYFVTALAISAQAHKDMVAAVAPCIDTAISKTVNVPEDYPYADFEGLYLEAWQAGLKGLATYRPNKVLGAVLSVDAGSQQKQPQDVTIDGANKLGKYVGICGQGPSDHADFAEWLMDEGIQTISLNPDTVVDTWLKLAAHKKS